MVWEVVLGLETDPLVTDEESRVPCQLVQTITARWSCQPGEDGSPLFIFRNSSNLPTSSSIFVYTNIYFILNTFHPISFWWILSEDVTLENHWVSRMVIKSTLKWKQNQKLSFVANWSVDSLFLIVDFLSGLDQCAEGTAAGTYSVIHLVPLNIFINRYTSNQRNGHIYLNIVLLPGLGPQQPYGNGGGDEQAVREEFR